jgi:hypothetical protein
MKFTQADMRRMRTPGKYNDGHGLILHVINKDRRTWILRYMRAGKDRMMASAVPMSYRSMTRAKKPRRHASC